jgi:hypothetical protein
MNWDAVFSEHKGKPVSEIARAVGKTKGAVRIAGRYRGVKFPAEQYTQKPTAPMPEEKRAEIHARLRALHRQNVAPQEITRAIQPIWPGASLRQVIGVIGALQSRQYVARRA